MIPWAAARELTINGPMGGSTDANLGRLRIDSGAVIGGDVVHASEGERRLPIGRTSVATCSAGTRSGPATSHSLPRTC